MKGPLAVKPEIYKQRQVIVINSTTELTTVVPLSTVAPKTPTKIHHKIAAGTYPFLDPRDDNWVKGDLITTVSNQRLDRPYVAGRRETVKISPEDLKEVRKVVLHALAMSTLVSNL
nr:type II toxin-antitoxin system PemK/MazF family toxin [Asticcacaulis excentricus]